MHRQLTIFYTKIIRGVVYGQYPNCSIQTMSQVNKSTEMLYLARKILTQNTCTGAITVLYIIIIIIDMSEQTRSKVRYLVQLIS